MKKIKFFLSLMLSLVALAANAQNVTVRGTVTDANSGDGIPAAAVQVKGTTTGTVADANGNYTIVAPANGTLVFSSIGYAAVDVAVNGKTVVNVELNSDSMFLDDAVIVGYGSAKKVGSLVGSVTTVKSETLKSGASTSAMDNLQGVVAGLNVLSTGGVSGDNAISMKIHGMGSLGSSSEPLFVIDGVPSSSRSVMNMNPNDILSVSILKDAASTSIYGSRAANGVVYVTTKAGSYDTKASASVSGQYGISTLANQQFYDNFMSGDNLKDFWMRAGIYSPAEIKATYTDLGHNANTKWYEYFQQQNNPQHQADVTVQGGGSKVSYLVSASEFYQRGTTVGNEYRRYTLRSNVQARPFNWLKVGMNVSGAIDNRRSNPNWGDSANAGGNNYTSGGLSFLLNPLYHAIDPETNKEYEIQFPNGSYNPKYYVSNAWTQYDRYSVNGSVFVEIEPVKNLKLTSRLGTDTYLSVGNQYRKASYIPSNGKGSRSQSYGLSSNNTITNTIEYSFTVAKLHSLSFLVGHEGVSNASKSSSLGSSGQTDDRLLILQQGTQDTYSVSESASASKFLSFFGNANYSYADRYFLDVTVRNDASSRFGKNKRNATFWSVGGMWKIKNEKFMQNAGFVNNLDLKVSYGTQGNAAIGNYSHLALIAQGTDYAGNSSLAVAQPSNNDLTWEQQALLTAGISGRMWDIFTFDLSFYNRQTSSMLMAVPYPYTSGFSEVTANVGGLRNTGVDIELGVDIVRGKDYYLNFNTTFNYNKEVVTELFNGLDRWEIPNTGITYVVGSPVMFYYPIYAGVDPEDGQQMWYLPGENKDVTTMDPNRVTKTFNEDDLTQNTGRVRNEPFVGGFGLSGSWKGLSLLCNFSYVLGKSLINNDAFFYANPVRFAGMNTHNGVSDFWTPENRNAKYPDWTSGASMQFDTHLLQDASFLRLKQLRIAYDFPKKWFNNCPVKGVQVNFTGRNLLTFTNYEGVDPEADSNLTLGLPGNTKQFLGGLEIRF